MPERPDGPYFEDENFHQYHLVSSRLAEELRFGKKDCSRLSPAVRDLYGFGKPAQAQHREDAEQWAGRENDEGVTPGDDVHHLRNQLDRDRSQQKSDAHLQRQRRADVLTASPRML